jgi:hypothetical protein
MLQASFGVPPDNFFGKLSVTVRYQWLRECPSRLDPRSAKISQTLGLERFALKRLDDILHVYPLMGGHALQNDGRQPPFDPGMQRDGHSLKPGIQSLQANMAPDLLDKMIVPMPTEACD